MTLVFRLRSRPEFATENVVSAGKPNNQVMKLKMRGNFPRSEVLCIMLNRPVRDQWEYPRKMERHFPIKLGQLIGMALVIFIPFPNSLIRAKNRFVRNGTANFGRNFGEFRPK